MDSLYTPSAWGAMYHALTTHEALGAGSAGPGKSLVLLMDPIYQVKTEHDRCLLPKDHPHHIEWGTSTGWALHLRRMSPMLDQTVARSKRMFPLIDPDAKFDEKHRTWTFKSGYRYQFGHCKDKDDWDIYLSNEYTHIAFDELIQFEEEQYEQITSRLRSSDPVLRSMLKVRAMSNPMQTNGVDHFDIRVADPQWVRTRFVDPAPEGKVLLKRKLKRRDGTVFYRTRIYLPATLYDNPDPEFVRNYEETLIGKPEHIKQAMLFGNWYITVGSHYAEEWRPDLHVCRPFRIPSDWPQVRSMDWGFKKPGVIYWGALDPEGNLYVHKEFTFRGKTATKVAEEAKAIEKDLGLWSGRSKILGWADNQLWEQRGESARSKAEEFNAVGMNWKKADKRSRQRNSERLMERLKDHASGTKTPGIVFFTTCRQALRTIPSIPSDPDNPECPIDGGEDHWHDGILYMCAGVSRGRAGVPSVTDLDDDDGYDDAPPQSRGRYGYGSSLC